MKRYCVIALLFLTLAAAAAGQSTVYQAAFVNATAASGTFGPVRDINQTAHWFSCYANGSQTAAVTISIQALIGPGYVDISQDAQIAPLVGSQAIVQASGYYPNVRVIYSGLAGAGAQLNCQYAGSVGPIPLPQNVGLVAPTSQIVTQYPVRFDVSNAGMSAATSLTTVTSGLVAFSGYAMNPNAGTVYVGLSALNNLTAISQAAIFVAVPATSGAAFTLPAIGFQFFSQGGTLYSYCSTSATALVDPAANCFVSVQFKPLVGVAPN